MYINFRNKTLKNNTSKKTENKIQTTSSTNFESKPIKLFSKTISNSRNLNFISLHKKQKTSKIYLQTFNNININSKEEEQKSLVSTKIKFYNNPKNINRIQNIHVHKGTSYMSNRTHNKNKNVEKFILYKNLKTESDKSTDIVPIIGNNLLLSDSNINNTQRIKDNIIPFSLNKINNNNHHHNLIYRNSINDIRSSTEKNIFNKRYSKTFIPKIKTNIRKSFSHYNTNNVINKKNVNCYITNPDLKDKINQLLKDLSNNHKTDIKRYENGGDISQKKIKRKKTKNKNNSKTMDFMAKKNRNKFFNLLNRDGSLNSFLKTMKFKTTNNIFKTFSHKEHQIKKPKNTFEMNKLLINSFGLNKGGVNDMSKKLYSLNETFFTIMNEMKKAKAEMELEKLDKNKKNIPLTVEMMKKTEKEWEKKFLLNMYNNKLSEKEFKNFKKLNKIQQKKEILKESQQLADNLMKIDAEEYEEPDDLYEYKSTRSFVSSINVYRIRRVKRIMKNIEDKEQLGAYDVNVEKLKQNQKQSETEAMLAIKRSGKPRFVKTQFKSSTIRKYKGVSGDYFGLPA